MTDPQPFLEMTLSGETMQAGRVRSKELGEMMGAFEDMVAYVVLRKEPDLRSDTIIVGLTAVQAGSIKLTFQPNLHRLTSPAIVEMIRAFATHHFEALPLGAIKAAASIVAFVKKHLCEIDLRFFDGEMEHTALITPATEVKPKSPLVGWTTLYGEIKRVGGLTPRVTLRTVSGQSVYCDVSANLAKQIGYRLYSQVAVQGTAKWDAESWRLDSFRIERLLDYEEIPLPEAGAALQAVIGERFAAVDDVPHFVRQIRRGEV